MTVVYFIDRQAGDVKSEGKVDDCRRKSEVVKEKIVC